ncbi:MAG: alternative ribosome rescue aminoacyl-tRNA hydrolase ArfB [Patescibacteria group bacterium]
MVHNVAIPLSEINLDFARSGGKGGQNVNKVETKVILRWHVGASLVFSEVEKQRIREKLANRLTADDDIILAVDEERTQAQNRSIGIERLNTLITQALIIPKKRRGTKPTKSSEERRLKAKKRTSAVKRIRRIKINLGD